MDRVRDRKSRMGSLRVEGGIESHGFEPGRISVETIEVVLDRTRFDLHYSLESLIYYHRV